MTGRKRKKKHPLWADVPVEKPADDQLGRAPFAKTVAKTIQSMKGTESFVFAICGPWGCGKSSVLRMICKQLQKGSGATKPIIVDFNPWWFGGQEQLLASFLGQLAAVLGRPDAGSGVSELGKKLSTLAKVLRPFGWIPGAEIVKETGQVIQAGADAATSLGERLTADVHRLRADIDKELRKSRQRIVIVMDDIDRLTAAEIAQLFVIVKAVADFPNTVYLLSFDHSVVCKAIADKLGLDGAAYLEKIVQIHIDVPPAGPVTLQQMFLRQLNDLIPSEEVNEKTRKDFLNLFHDGLKTFFETPRSVKRLTNVLRVLFPGLAGEVYWPDFIAMTALQVFVPDSYRTIRDNKERFAGHVRESGIYNNQEEEKKFHDEWQQQIDQAQHEVVTDLVKRLFPRVAGPSYGSEWESIWKADLRICSEACFDRYFQFQVPKGAISEAEWKQFLTLLPSPDLADKQIEKWCSERGPNGLASRAKEFLDKVQVFAKHQATVDSARDLLSVVLRKGDSLIAVEDSERVILMSIDNELRLIWAVLSLLEKIPEGADRDYALEQSLPAAGLRTISKVVYSLGIQHGKFGSEPNKDYQPRAVSDNCVGRLTDIALTRLREAAADGSLITGPEPMMLLRDWRLFSNSDEAQQWIDEASKDDNTLTRLLKSAQTSTASHSGDDRVVTEGVSASASFLLMWFDGVALRQRCQSILESDANWLTEDYRSVLQLVIDSIDESGQALDPFTRHPRRSQVSTAREPKYDEADATDI